MKCVILQPSYIPWRGYFHQIHKADVFVFYDDVQYDKHGWRNRNRIKTHQGPRWLTIPVLSRHAPLEHTPIQQIMIDRRQPWNRKHWMTLAQSYTSAPFFSRYADFLEAFYRNPPPYLADFTIELTVALARQLGIEHTRFIRSSEMNVTGAKTERLIQILACLGADHYISGPAAKNYIDPSQFASAGIRLEYMEYNYPEYEQLYPPYDPQVSVLDLMFMKGPQALSYIVGKG
jgi:hypothetical protein